MGKHSKEKEDSAMAQKSTTIHILQQKQVSADNILQQRRCFLKDNQTFEEKHAFIGKPHVKRSVYLGIARLGGRGVQLLFEQCPNRGDAIFNGASPTIGVSARIYLA